MRNVLVTGGAGFIGSNFVHYLLKVESELRIINLDALTYAGSLENLKELPDPERHIFVHGDIRDKELVAGLLAQYQVDTLVHFAAETHVDRSILGPEQFIQTNVMGTFTLLEAVRHYWADAGNGMRKGVRYHFVSTDEVFGSLKPGEPPWMEQTPYAPNSPYAASKAACDHLVRAYGHTYGLPYSITNCSNNYGPYQFPEKLIPLMILNALAGRALPVYGDGGQIRDWLYVEDHCEAIWLVLRSDVPGETYTIGGDNQPTNLQMITMLCLVLDELLPGAPYVPHQSLMQHVKDRPGHDRRYAMDSTKIRRELGWRPRHDLESGLRQTVIWYLEHSAWLTAITKQEGYHQWMHANYQDRGRT